MKKKKEDESMLRGNNLERMALSEWMNVVSGNECTGLMPFLPETIEEDRKLSSLYGIHSASKKREKHGKK